MYFPQQQCSVNISVDEITKWLSNLILSIPYPRYVLISCLAKSSVTVAMTGRGKRPESSTMKVIKYVLFGMIKMHVCFLVSYAQSHGGCETDKIVWCTLILTFDFLKKAIIFPPTKFCNNYMNQDINFTMKYVASAWNVLKLILISQSAHILF